MENGQYVPGSLWFYAPNKVAPAIWAALFAISGCIHAWQCTHYKSWKVTGVLPWSGLCFTVGYALREYGAFHYDDVNIFISSTVFVYCAPPLYEVSNYIVLSRMLYYIPYHSPIHPGRVLTTFAAIGSIVEAFNGTGASFTANPRNSPGKQATGRALLKAALILQLAIMASFVLLASRFHRKCKRAGIFPSNLRSALITLYISVALIGTRTIYRTLEYFTEAGLKFTAADINSVTPILRYEWFFWFFEATLMMINSWLLNARHPMRFLPRDNKIYLAEDGVTEILGPGYEDKRGFLVTLVDPFDLAGIAKGRNMNERFWETHAEGKVVNSTAPSGDVEMASAEDGARA